MFYKVSVANLEIAAGGNTYYLKPITLPDIEKFVQLKNEYKINWEKHEIVGTITLPGETWNILFTNGLFFFLEKIQSYSEKQHLYKVIRWFWVNDVLGARGKTVRIEGILSKTNDENIVLNNILRTIPTIDTGNKIIYNAVDIKKDETITRADELVNLPKAWLKDPKNYYKYFSAPSQQPDLNEAEGQVDNPLPSFNSLYQATPVFNWQVALLNELETYLNDPERNMEVWDFNTSKSTAYLKLSTKYPSNKNSFYVISDDKFTGARHFAHQKSLHKDFQNIDLSTLQEIRKIKDDDLVTQLKLSGKQRVRNIYGVTGAGFNNVIKNVKLKLKVNPRIYIKDEVQIDLPSDLGEIKHGENEATPILITKDSPEIITGYEQDESGAYTKPITETLRDIKRDYYVVNLNKYQILHEDQEFTEDTLLKRYSDVIGEEQEKGAWDVSDAGITVLKSGKNWVKYAVHFKTVKLSNGITVGGRDEIKLLVFEPLIQPDKAITKLVLPASGPRNENRGWYFWAEYFRTWWNSSNSRYAADGGYGFLGTGKKTTIRDRNERYTNDPFWEGRPWDGIYNSHTYKDSDIEGVIKTVINKWIYGGRGAGGAGGAAVGPFQQIIVQLPTAIADKEGLKTLSDSEQGKLIFEDDWEPDNETTDVVNFCYSNKYKYASSCSFYAQPFYNRYSVQTEPTPHCGIFANAKQNITCTQETLLKAVETFFKYWDDLEKKGDFYVSRHRDKLKDAVSTHKRYCFTFFKVYNGQTYRLGFVFRNSRDDTEYAGVGPWTRPRWYSDYISWGIYWKLEPDNKNDNTKGATASNFIQWLFLLARSNNIHSGQNGSDYESGYTLKGWWDFQKWELYINRSLSVPNYREAGWTKTYVPWTGSYELPTYTEQLRSKGIKVPEEEIEWITLTEDTPELFDLVGTNFYVYRTVVEGKPYFELIVKNNDSSLVNVIKDLHREITSTVTVKDPVQVVNSSNALFTWGELTPLKWRGVINGKVRFPRFEIRTLPVEEEMANFQATDFYLLTLYTEADAIKNVIRVTKPISKIKTNISSLGEYEEIKYRTRQEMQLQRNTLTQFYNSKNRFHAGLMANQEDINMAEEWRTYNKWMSWGSVGMQALTGLINPIGLLGIGSSIANTYAQNAKQEQDLYKQKRDHEINKRFGTEEFKLRTEASQINFDLANMASVRNLVNLQSNVQIASSSDTTLHKSITTLEQTAPVYLQTTVPDGYIYDELKKHYEDYGYDINLSSFSLQASDLKEKDVWKFHRVKKVSGITCPIISQAVREIFEAGFKVV